jgi:hypothetical protein
VQGKGTLTQVGGIDEAATLSRKDKALILVVAGVLIQALEAVLHVTRVPVLIQVHREDVAGVLLRMKMSYCCSRG